MLLWTVWRRDLVPILPFRSFCLFIAWMSEAAVNDDSMEHKLNKLHTTNYVLIVSANIWKLLWKTHLMTIWLGRNKEHDSNHHHLVNVETPNAFRKYLFSSSSKVYLYATFRYKKLGWFYIFYFDLFFAPFLSGCFKNIFRNFGDTFLLKTSI